MIGLHDDTMTQPAGTNSSRQIHARIAGPRDKLHKHRRDMARREPGGSPAYDLPGAAHQPPLQGHRSLHEAFSVQDHTARGRLDQERRPLSLLNLIQQLRLHGNKLFDLPLQQQPF